VVRDITVFFVSKWNNTLNQENRKHSSAWALRRGSPHHGVFLANHLASTDNLTRTNKRQNTLLYKCKITIQKRGPNKLQHTEKQYCLWRMASATSRHMVTFPAARHHRPLAGTKLYCLIMEAQRELCLLAICHKRPLNRGGLFLQPKTCTDPHQTGFVGKGSEHLLLIKFWPSRASGRNFLEPPYCSQHAVFASRLFHS